MRNAEPQPQLRNPQMKSALCAQQTHFNAMSLQKDTFSLSLPQLAYRTARLLKGPLWSLEAASTCSPLSSGCPFPVLSWIEWVLAATEASLVCKAVVTGTPTGLLGPNARLQPSLAWVLPLTQKHIFRCTIFIKNQE